MRLGLERSCACKFSRERYIRGLSETAQSLSPGLLCGPVEFYLTLTAPKGNDSGDFFSLARDYPARKFLSHFGKIREDSFTGAKCSKNDSRENEEREDISGRVFERES